MNYNCCSLSRYNYRHSLYLCAWWRVLTDQLTYTQSARPPRREVGMSWD